jgi:Berberine and berberine like
MLVLGYTDPSLASTVDEFATSAISAFNATSGFDELRVYVSYARGTEGLEAMYGPRKLGRLLALKKEWDPDGLFVFNNPLPPP